MPSLVDHVRYLGFLVENPTRRAYPMIRLLIVATIAFTTIRTQTFIAQYQVLASTTNANLSGIQEPPGFLPTLALHLQPYIAKGVRVRIS